ncbi:uncharacterized protein LOC8286677 isoform X2 [Ricinus communis]|uniref:uncharacterized protein LOC8286677 isoform X2 n=1 Tax=Ricinus communis TaxID=3988 RepID=UPI00077274E1|nr:uncharacterized protein LOC8286677 isoform X2 [Ricinus communis]|eukprot:XP_015583670.1 uncharacterized protein LOC8286677 isoform X2 [Ricinus communis]
MANLLSHASITPRLNSDHQNIIFSPIYPRKFNRIRCNGENPSTRKESEPENALLKVAWYSSELLGIAASFFRSPSVTSEANFKLSIDDLGSIDRATVVQSIKDDFQRSYFVTGNLTSDAYEEDCEFADPAGSFKGLRRFKRNCTNFGLLLEKSNMKLMKWEDFELLDIRSTILMCSPEEYAGMSNIGMYPKWHF